MKRGVGVSATRRRHTIFFPGNNEWSFLNRPHARKDGLNRTVGQVHGLKGGVGVRGNRRRQRNIRCVISLIYYQRV